MKTLITANVPAENLAGYRTELTACHTAQGGRYMPDMRRLHKLSGLLLTAVIVVLALVTHAQGEDKGEAAGSPLKPDFTVIVVKGGGLWPQIQFAADGTLLAFGYNAAAHTTLPGDVDGWASTDGGKTWALRETAAARPDKSANMCHWASGFYANGELLVLASGMDDAANERGRRLW